MALDMTRLACSTPSRSGKAPVLWLYKTDDGITTIDGAGYFNAGTAYQGAYNLMQMGDWVLATIVTNLGASNETFSDSAIFLVNSKASGVLDCTNEVVALATTDSD